MLFCSFICNSQEMNRLFASGSQNIGASTLASVLPMNSQGWFPLGLIAVQGTLRVLPSTTIQKHQFFNTEPYLWFNFHIWYDYWKNHNFNYVNLCQLNDVSVFLFVLFFVFNTLSRFGIAFLLRSKFLLISLLPSPSTMILKLNKIKSVTVSTFLPSICHEMMGLCAMMLVFWMLSLKPASSFLFHPHQKAFSDFLAQWSVCKSHNLKVPSFISCRSVIPLASHVWTLVSDAGPGICAVFLREETGVCPLMVGLRSFPSDGQSHDKRYALRQLWAQ